MPGKRYVALYGTPGRASLGLLGEQGVAASVDRARQYARNFAARTGDTVVPAVEIIATVASAGAGTDGDYSAERPVDELRPLVEAAGEAGLSVVLDLQPGRTDFLTQAKRYTELLELPHVGLALDPGAYPARGLAPGDRVNVVLTAEAGGLETEPTVIARGATVFAVDELASDRLLVSVLATEADAEAVAAAAGAGGLRLVLVAP